MPILRLPFRDNGLDLISPKIMLLKRHAARDGSNLYTKQIRFLMQHFEMHRENLSQTGDQNRQKSEFVQNQDLQMKRRGCFINGLGWGRRGCGGINDNRCQMSFHKSLPVINCLVYE